MMFPQPYDWKITVWKGFQIILVGGFGTIVGYFSAWPPELMTLLTLVLYKMLQNFLKNSYV